MGEIPPRLGAHDETCAYRSLFELSLDLLAVARPDGWFEEVSPSFERVLGYAPEELLAQPFLDFVHPDDRQATIAEVSKLATTGGMTVSFPNRYRCKDGTYRWLDWTGAMDKDCKRLYCTARDITEQKRLELELRASIEQIRAASVAFEQQNRELEREIEERTRAEAELRKQEEALRDLSAPILRVADGVLLLPVIGKLDAGRARTMMESLLSAIVQSASSVTILDLTGVGAVDAATSEHLLEIVRAVGLLGSRCLVSGIPPAVARTMVELGIDIGKLRTFGTLAEALESALGERR
jgi:PAS domain S-box-containing protein